MNPNPQPIPGLFLDDSIYNFYKRSGENLEQTQSSKKKKIKFGILKRKKVTLRRKRKVTRKRKTSGRKKTTRRKTTTRKRKVTGRKTTGTRRKSTRVTPAYSYPRSNDKYWRVSFEFKFKRSEGSMEPSPTKEQLINFMKQRYHSFVEDLYKWDAGYGLPFDIEYYNNVVTFTIAKNSMLSTKKDVIRSISESSLADGAWEGMPGTTAVYPDSRGNELGVIDIDNKFMGGIHVSAVSGTRGNPKREPDDIYERAQWVATQLGISPERILKNFDELDNNKYNSRYELKLAYEKYTGNPNTFFGKKRSSKRWIQSVTKSFEKKGTKGAFTRWCKSKGFSSVSLSCIDLGKKSKSLRTRRRAVFAQNIRKKNSKKRST
jgi:hypothetical protein